MSVLSQQSSNIVAVLDGLVFSANNRYKMASENEFQLFTSLRYDPLLLESQENSRPILNFVAPSPFYMLAYHRDRMVEAAQHFGFDAVEKRLQDGKALHEGHIFQAFSSCCFAYKMLCSCNDPIKL